MYIYIFFHLYPFSPEWGVGPLGRGEVARVLYRRGVKPPAFHAGHERSTYANSIWCSKAVTQCCLTNLTSLIRQEAIYIYTHIYIYIYICIYICAFSTPRCKHAARPISAVKQRWVWLVVGWVTAWEHQMLMAHIERSCPA